MIHYKVIKPEKWWKPWDRAQYRLLEDVIYNTKIPESFSFAHCVHHNTGHLHLQPGFTWDGATGGIDTLSFMKASLIHDALCQAILPEKVLSASYQATIDRIMYQVARAGEETDEQMNWLRAKYTFQAVRNYQRISRWNQIRRGEVIP